MFRLRRYRVFLILAVITVLALYKFSTATGTSWREAASNAADRLKSERKNELQQDWKPKPPPPVAAETRKFEVTVPAATSPLLLQTPPPVAPNTLLVDKKPALASLHAALTELQKPSIPTPQIVPHGNGGGVAPGGELPASIDAIHWTKLPEDFPVPSQSLIQLPSGKPKPIPKIQFDFAPENAAAKADRESKLSMIKDVFKRSWNGYKANAWLHDELTPVSGGFKDPFAGWGATLVDSLDTLWIMGLKVEFEDAVNALHKIDFTTTSRADIPLFETTIRYLGGMLAAYDLSGNEYKILLDKSLELAEILISAFDTPNRMPETYYYWRPQFASQKHRSSKNMVLAEIGSLSMEFTRLAQLTGEHKYYDAIARITDNLEEFQKNTRLPGMWPTRLDASGCKTIYLDTPIQAPLKVSENRPPGKHDIPSANPESKADATPTDKVSPEGKKYIPLDLPEPVVFIPNGQNPNWVPSKAKRHVLDADKDIPLEAALLDAQPTPAMPVPPPCVSQGFSSSSQYGREEYTLGGMSDSTYEYLSKEWLLLGGQIEKYRTMYEQSMDVVKEHLIFRPMLPNEDDILFSGKLWVPLQTADDTNAKTELEAENAHLTCFAGGMFGMGAKLFDRPEDLEIAKKLTEGCVWSYDMTQTGIMPEGFEAIPCKSTKSCAWNETLYNEILDPRAEFREESYKAQMEYYSQQLVSASSWYEQQLASMTAAPTSSAPGAFEAHATFTTIFADIHERQLADLEEDFEPPVNPPSRVQSTPAVADPDPSPSRVLPEFPILFSPGPALPHKEYVENRIKEERLPPGVTKIPQRAYILRPEAIESVWYMYRITGSAHWREAGWRMFLAISEHTATTHGNSAINDVTQTKPVASDSMESFWLAETLKYFYLLFSEESVVSLDEWVLNTEAHPFRRPV